MVTASPETVPRVVVGYDGSPGSAAAVEWAVDEANARGVPLEVRSVVEPATAMAVDVLGEGWVDDAQQVAERLAEHGVERAAVTAQVPVIARGVVGHPSASLVAASEGAALLVVGAHSEDHPPGTLVGSVAFAVTVHARCPVAIVRGAPPSRAGVGRPVVVGVDGSRSATAAVLEAADLAARSGAELVVVSAWRSPVLTRWEADPDEPGRQRRTSQLRRLAAESVASAEADRARHVHPGLAVSTRVLEGAPARLLAELSPDVGALVVGSRGHGGFAGLLLGSVTRRLVHEASCPVLVVRRVLGRPEASPVGARASQSIEES